MRVLVVDDDEAGRYLASSILESFGHEAIVAADGFEALKIARRETPDVAVSDILMPRMDGFQLVREWKSDPELASIPIIFLTASYNDPADEKFAIEIGADGFLSKPVDPDLLLEAVEQAVLAAGGGEDSVARKPLQRPEAETLREYSERVVHKLEQKVDELERSNTLLEEAMEALSEEVRAKSALVDELNQQIQLGNRRESELRVERDFSAKIIETADVMIIGTDRDGTITLFNPGAERVSGQISAEIMGEDFVDTLIPGGFVAETRAAMVRLMAGEGPLRLIQPIVRYDGEEREIDWTVTATTDEFDGITGTIGFGMDVTDRVISAAADHVMKLIDLAVLFDRPITQVLSDSVSSIAEQFGFEAAWVATLSQGGPELGVVAGAESEMVEAILSSDATLAIGSITETADLQEPERYGGSSPRPISQIVGPTGGSSGFSTAAIIPIQVHGNVVGVVGVLSRGTHASSPPRLKALADVADRLGVAILISEARQQLQLQSAALSSAASPIIICDSKANVEWVNPAFVRQTGYTSEDVLGASLFGEGEGYREPGYAVGWEDVLGGAVWHFTGENRGRDGDEYIESVTIAPVRGDDRSVSHVVIVKHDITARSRFEQLRSDFIAMVSHELRTPLTSVIGYSDLLSHMGADLDPSKVAVAVAKVRSSAGLMQDNVERLLEVAQMQTEGVALSPQSIDLVRVVKDTVGGMDHPPSHVLEVAADEDSIECWCDSDRIMRAVSSLVDNAIKFSPDGGTVDVFVARENGDAVIRVQDHGVGMPERQIPTMFEAFRQLDMSSTREFGGIGLGLFLAYRIAEAHGGRLTGTSKLKEGSVFELRFPSSR